MHAGQKLAIVAGLLAAMLLNTAGAEPMAQNAEIGGEQPFVAPGSSGGAEVSGPTVRDMRTVGQTSVAPGASPPQQLLMPGPLGGAGPDEYAARQAAAATDPNAPRATNPLSDAPSAPPIAVRGLPTSSLISGQDQGGDAPAAADPSSSHTVTGAQDQAAGSAATLEGRLLIGPISPVQVGPTDAGPPPELCLGQSLLVLLPDQQTVVARTALQSDCSYRLSLPPGAYVVSLQSNDFGQLSQTVQVEGGRTAELNFTIDTGVY